MECLTRTVNSTPPYMFDRVLNVPLDYLSYFAVALIGINRGVDVNKTGYGTTFKLTKGYQRLKKNDQQLSLMFLLFVSFSLFQCARQ